MIGMSIVQSIDPLFPSGASSAFILSVVGRHN